MDNNNYNPNINNGYNPNVNNEYNPNINNGYNPNMYGGNGQGYNNMPYMQNTSPMKPKKRRKTGPVVLSIFIAILLVIDISFIGLKIGIFSEGTLKDMLIKVSENMQDDIYTDFPKTNEEAVRRAMDNVAGYVSDFLLNGELPDRAAVTSDMGKIYDMVIEESAEEILKDLEDAGEIEVDNLISYERFADLKDFLGTSEYNKLIERIREDIGDTIIVNKDTMTIEDYNTSDDTVKYFKKLNEEYQKGFVDPESFTQTYDEYIAKLSTGRVLGMVDQWWDFAYTVNDVFKQQGLNEKGCNYVPLGLTTEEGMENRWHSYGDTVNQASGVAITKDCKDPDKAFKFIVDCAMDQELHDLRFWGVKDVDYTVDENGLYARTQEQRMNWSDTAYQASHRCQYSYMPQWGGTSDDGINANKPEEQPAEFQVDMAQPLKDCLAAYGAGNYVDMIGSVVETNEPWFPMYSYSNNFTTETPGGVAWTKMGETKHEYLPKVVMASDFETGWAEYMDAYNACKPEDFISEMQAILDTFK